MSAIGDPRLQPQDVRLYIDAEALAEAGEDFA
jgi:hypothetical protein